MLFITRYHARGRLTEAEEKRVLQLFSKWQPAPGEEIKGWWIAADGTGITLSEAASAEAVLEGLAPWHVYFEFNVQPAVEVAKAAEIMAKGIAWRDSIKT